MSIELEPSADHAAIAKVIAMCVRNELEDFHVRYLSDAQMKELNPLIRNAIYTALHALSIFPHSKAAGRFIDFQARLVPSYWEEPQLTNSWLELVQAIEEDPTLGD